MTFQTGCNVQRPEQPHLHMLQKPRPRPAVLIFMARQIHLHQILGWSLVVGEEGREIPVDIVTHINTLSMWVPSNAQLARDRT